MDSIVIEKNKFESNDTMTVQSMKFYKTKLKDEVGFTITLHKIDSLETKGNHFLIEVSENRFQISRIFFDYLVDYHESGGMIIMEDIVQGGEIYIPNESFPQDYVLHLRKVVIYDKKFSIYILYDCQYMFYLKRL